MADYTNFNDRYEEQTRWTKDFQREILHGMTTVPPWKVLEVGAGTGAVLRQMARMTSTAFSFYGIDNNLEVLHYAKNREDSEFTNADGHDLPFPDGMFDLVFCHYLLLWTERPTAVIREMARVCKTGGRIAILAEPDYTGRVSYPDSISALAEKQTEALVMQGMESSAGRKLKMWLNQAGFQQAKVGVHEAVFQGEAYQAFLRSEWEQAALDSGVGKPVDLDIPSSSIFYVPTFYAVITKQG